MNVGNEIITLQVGNYSNYVGTHWWNLQESSFNYDDAKAISEINHDILFREGQNFRRETTYTPRLVLVDLKQNFGCLPIHDSLLYRINHEASTTWNDQPEIYQQSPAKKNQFLEDLEEEDKRYETTLNGDGDDIQADGAHNPDVAAAQATLPLKYRKYELDDEVRAWSDFKRAHYHPRTVLSINHNHEKFASWTAGAAAASRRVLEHFEETVRSYAEECDHMQGFNLLADADSGFSGLACAFAQQLRDEYRAKPIATCLPFHADAQTGDHALAASLSTVLSLSAMLEHSSYVVPLSLSETLFPSPPGVVREFPGLVYDARQRYHTSAVLAACYEVMMRGYRLQRRPHATLADAAQRLVCGPRKLLALSAALPANYDVAAHDPVQAMSRHDDVATALTPSTCVGDAECYAQDVTYAGLAPEFGNGRCRYEEWCDRIASAVQTRFNASRPGTTTTVRVVRDPLTLLAPFPRIVRAKRAERGDLSPTQRGSMSGRTTLSNGSGLARLLRDAYKRGDKIKRWTARDRHCDVANESDMLEESCERLKNLADEYKCSVANGFDSDSDSDD